jgi:21S rRNA (GM2251-2'-O)-methyltransferase
VIIYLVHVLSNYNQPSPRERPPLTLVLEEFLLSIIENIRSCEGAFMIMRQLLSIGNGCKYGVKSLLVNPIPSLYPGLRLSRAASLNSAIGRGLRKSKGVGFRGKERSAAKSDGLVRRSADLVHAGGKAKMTRDAWRMENASLRHSKGEKQLGSQDSHSSRPRMRRGKVDIKSDANGSTRRSRAARFNDPNFRMGKKSLERRGRLDTEPQDRLGNGAPTRKAEGDSRQRNTESLDSRPNYRTARESQGAQDFGRDWHRSSRVDEQGSRHNSHGKDSNTGQPTITRTRDDRLPLSIPYTTPASEFLYGTSVVEAALRSHRNPRRKLYKMYIYSGENCENSERDAIIERLARENGVNVQYVGADWLRIMDKMSGGRPHNGYILEASPLPRLPVTSLGALTSQNNKSGVIVSLDHQSREEAAVNGTSNFIPLPQDRLGRKPFVLLLDSIVDPGNLGGIIRTASFLGVTAIAISTRNSASFTPVVLKASAGASENIILFSVRKPAGFVIDSKAAGWKVYAAVAPSGKREYATPPSITTDELEDPLQESPCILMLGNEGEGLRWNLRSKADIEIGILGSGMIESVDSMNVSVATGILCDAFLRSRRSGSEHERKAEGTEIRRKRERPVKDLF